MKLIEFRIDLGQDGEVTRSLKATTDERAIELMSAKFPDAKRISVISSRSVTSDDLRQEAHNFESPDDFDARSPRRNGNLWLFSILVPILLLCASIIYSKAQPLSQSDWMGGAFILPFFIGTVISAFAALGISIASVLKGERFAFIAFLVGLVALIYMAFVLVVLSGARE